MRILTNVSKTELDYLTSQPTAKAMQEKKVNAIEQQISMLSMQLIQLQKINNETSAV